MKSHYNPMGGGRGTLRIEFWNFFSVLWRPIHMFFIFDYEIMNTYVCFENFFCKFLGNRGPRVLKMGPLAEKSSMENLFAYSFVRSHSVGQNKTLDTKIVPLS